MRLLVVSHTPHYMREETIVGWGATVREIDELTKLFESVVHVAPMYAGEAPGSSMPYRSERVRLRAVRPAGGERLVDKLSIPWRYPGYARAILQERRNADVIHVRAPANISLLALLLLAFLEHPAIRWAKYAGDWNRQNGEPWSYRFQRWWLAKGFHRGIVTVNGCSTRLAHVHSLLNPCLTETELKEGEAASRRKKFEQPLKLLFVGRIEEAKGVGVCVEAVAELAKLGIVANLDLVGEGEERGRFEAQSRALGLNSRVRFHGGMPRERLGEFYSRAHFILLPSQTEGWPKVLSEAMAYGVVPLASAVGSIPEYLEQFSTGHAICERSSVHFARTVEKYVKVPASWEEQSRNAVAAARLFTYERYIEALRNLLNLPVAAQALAA